MLSTLENEDDMAGLGWFTERLHSFGELTAMIWKDNSFSYSLLLKHSDDWLIHLTDAGISKGSCVAIVGDFSPGTYSLLLALIRGGYTAVPISKSGYSKSSEKLKIACVKYVIEFDNDDNFVEKIIEKPNQHPLVKKLISKKEPGLILFTSGTSGNPNAVLHSFSRLLNKSRKPKRGKIVLTFLLLEHIGGIDILLHLFSIGGTAVFLGDRNAETVCKTVEKYKVDLIPTTVTFLKMLLMSKAYEKYDLSSLKIISYGSEPMPSSLLVTLNKVLPKIIFNQTYGLSELAVLQTKSKSNDSTWFSIKNSIETKIIDGRLWIKNNSAMLGYLNSDNNFDSDGWFDSGDKVIQEDEFFKILGRESELINIGGEKVFPSEIESVILELPDVYDVTVSGKLNVVMGSVVIAHVKPIEESNKEYLINKIRNHCKKRLDASYKVPAVIKISNKDHHSERFKKIRAGFDS
jgi:long-chain acyl-CoA synthetase